MKEPSPRPWQVRYGDTVADATGAKVAACLRPENAALIVDAVNGIEETKRLSIKLYDPIRRAEDERDRLRDIVRRLISIHQNVFWRKDEKTGMLYYDCAIDEEKIRKTIEEARAAIGEDRT